MSTIFASRHPGAICWMKKQPVHVDIWTDHLDIQTVKSGDTVIGSLPMHIAAAICAMGAHFLALDMSIPKERRGQELTAAEIETFSCSLQAYDVRPVDYRL